MNHYRIPSALLLAVVSVNMSILWGRSMSPDEVIARLTPSYKCVSGKNTQSYAYDLVQTRETKDGTIPMIYVFNRIDSESSLNPDSLQKTRGFIVTASDDRFPLLLGYSEQGVYNVDDVPPQLQWWIEEYCNQMEWAVENRAVSASRKASQTPFDESWDAVEPLVRTQWNQSTPYSNFCPNQYSTGCVATAAAQVVKKWEWPVENGEGSHSYKWGSQTLTFDYSSSRFDWENMLDDYESGSYSDKEAAAVAQLMYAIGVGVDMAYSSGGSGAPSYRLPNLLTNHFGYDKGVSFRIREYFSDAQWHKLIYDELKAGRPVLYGGQSRSVGHEFICDGYGGDGYYHINWGWSGRCDGYFRLSALEPSEHGIGGSTTGDGYNYDQEAVIGIQPPTSDTVEYLPIYAGGGFTVFLNRDSYIFAFGTPADPYGGMWSYSSAPLTTMLGFKMESTETGEVTYYDIGNVEWPGDSGEGVNGYYSFSINFSGFDFREGSYKLYPVVRTESIPWQEIAVPYGTSDHVVMDVDTAGKYTIHNGVPDNVARLSVTYFNQTSAPTSSSDGAYVITVDNTSDAPYSGYIIAEIYEPDTPDMLDSKEFSIDLNPFEEKNIRFRWTPAVPTGTYQIIFYTQYGTPISEPFEYTMEEIKTSDLTVEDCVPRNNPEIGIRTTYNVTIKNTSAVGYYSSITMKAFDSENDEAIGSEKFYPVITGEGEFKSNFTWQATKDGEIILRFYDVKDQLISGDFHITVSTSLGIDEISSRNEKYDIFTIQGIKMAEGVNYEDITRIGHGVFIIRDTSGNFRKIRI